MNSNLRIHKDHLLETTKKALTANQMEVVVLEKKEDVIPYIDSMIQSNMKVSVGGSQTLFEVGLVDYLVSRNDITFYNRYEEGVNTKEVFHHAFDTDYYFSSSNAITLDGYLYNVDATGNRVAALNYGPEHVVIIAGENKIVKDKEAAKQRVCTLATPANAIRLKRDTPCSKIGYCLDCKGKDRLCSYYSLIGYQRNPNRYTVILIKEDLGF